MMGLGLIIAIGRILCYALHYSFDKKALSRLSGTIIALSENCKVF